MKKFSLNKIFNNGILKVFFPFYRSKEIKTLFSILEKESYKNIPTAMFVGGCVRKHISNEDIDDIDIACILTPEEIKKKFQGSEFKIIDTGVEHGSITLILKNFKFEITTLRKDIKTDGRHADVSFIDDWLEDSKRRDFTINSIYMDKKGNFYDPQFGKKDLQKKIVRFIGDPASRIEEDYLRIIRFLRFSIQYECKETDHKTIEAIKLNLDGIKNLSKERMMNELYKIFKLNNVDVLLENEDLKEIFLIIFPELKYFKRLEKLLLFTKRKNISQEVESIFASLLVDDSDNFEYFCHKYKASNKLKDNLFYISKHYTEFKNDKNFLKTNFKKKIYYMGKKNIKKLLMYIFSVEKKFDQSTLIKKIEEIDTFQVPKFPLNGQFLIKQGLKDGKKIGLTLKKLEDEWVKNNFSLDEKIINSIVNKSKS